MTAAITLARQYLANLPQSPADGHEAIAYLSGVLAALDEQKPVVGDTALRRLLNTYADAAYWRIQLTTDEVWESITTHLAIRRLAAAQIAPEPAETRMDTGFQPLFASSNLLTAARHYASSYLQQERDYPRLCFDAQHHRDVCALFAAIEGEGATAIPDVLFDGNAVYAEVMATTPCATRTSPENVSEVLDAVVRLLRAPSAIAATKEGA